MTFAQRVLKFYDKLPEALDLPEHIEIIYPYNNSIVKTLMSEFYNKYYNDNNSRIFLWGINPGRFGAGVTGIPFTDPEHLESRCGIKNPYGKRHELSSVFIYSLIDRMGGPEAFYSRFYITSLSPLGYLKYGKNYNYYDDRETYEKLESFIVSSINTQLQFSTNSVAFSLGKGQNFKIFKSLNEKHNWYEKLIPLPHPRWVMQYQRRNLEHHLDDIISKLNNV